MSKFEVCGVHEVEGSVESSPISPTSRGCYLKALPRWPLSLLKNLNKVQIIITGFPFYSKCI